MSTTCFLLDGPLMTAIERRQAITEVMAIDLIRAGVPACEQDTIRILNHCGYYWLDVALLAEEARALAFQEIVAREMSKP